MKAERIEYEISDNEFRDVIDGLEGDIKICGMAYGAGYALQEIDPIAFRCAKNDYESEHGDTYKCTICDTEYDDEDEANECCSDKEG